MKNHLIIQNFDLKETEQSIEELRYNLKFKIQELLDTNMEKLLSILYRIDVSQKVTDEIFSIESKDDIAEKLTDAVVNRQIEKLKTRNHYKSPES